jgi:uncharacterized protein
MKRFLRDKLPKPETILENKYLHWLKPWLGHPRLWHMHRQSVALGVAIGVVTGLIPGPVQILLAIIVAIPFRANVLAAAAATFYTNPFTFIPLYMMAYSVGTLVTGEPISNLVPPDFSFSWSAPWQIVPDMFRWFASLGDSLLIGLAIQSTVFALLGYFGTRIIWRIAVTRLWRTRHARKRW